MNSLEVHNAVSLLHNNKCKETQFTDLNEDILRKIMGNLDDLSDRMNLRVTRRLDQFVMANTKLDKLELSLCRDYNFWSARLEVTSSSKTYAVREPVWRLDSIARGLHRWSQQKSLGEIRIRVRETPNMALNEMLETYFSVPADSLHFDAPFASLDHISLPTLLIAAQCFKKLKIIASTHLDVIDLCFLRKNMLAGDFKLESFTIRSIDNIRDTFLESCFGLTIEEDCREGLRMFAGTREYEKFLTTNSYFPDKLIHFKDDLMTTIEKNHISFNVISKAEKAAMMEDLYNVHMNFPYMRAG